MDSKTYKVNTLGHWQGIEETLNEIIAGNGNPVPDDGIVGEIGKIISQISDTGDSLSTEIAEQTQDIATELQKIENGQTSAAQQLTEIETLITTANSKLDTLNTSLGDKMDSVSTALEGMKTVMDSMLVVLQAIQTNTSGLTTTLSSLDSRLSAVEARTNFPLSEETETTLALTPNVYHQWGEVSSLDLTFTPGSNPDVVDEYVFQFTSPAQTPTVLTLPDTVKWIGDSEILTGLTYVVTVVNNLAVLGGA